MEILIQQAQVKDAAHIAPLIYDAIGDIAHRLTGETEEQAVLATLTELIKRTDNRHSYLYTYVAKQEDTLLGIAVLYDGLTAKELDANLAAWLQAKNASTIIDAEAHDDEFYIDTVCVTPHARGLGIGTKLLKFAEEQAIAKGYTKLSLNVELEKDKARALYERLGFTITEPWTIIDEPFHHMVKAL
ncbi:GNAT family N-acetyltransferase [Metasolibacillus meyeri]|uniref:GNAT family N-acetyltransferase n=1 Tax=Metasolibacillus meyeri TaxID=1071052 RepID=A0AAW9NYI2_9BACL|nr:GNAT family N-acetyltransferase [Metasolibacillus meyeri]MEC1180811.1 GNAT family N-acetyltransferase [Metasolibacillus meyeri]